VALPIQVPPDAEVITYSKDPGPEVALPPSSDVAIIGFPEGMSASGITPIWKSGSIASEPDLPIGDEEFFWIDANTRQGMSGSPVIARRFGGALMADGGYGVHTGTVDRVIGVYAGRAFEAPDMTLGRVWKWRGVQEVIEAAVAKFQRGTLRPHPCLVGHYSQPEKTMVQLNILQSVEVPVINPAGAIEKKPILLAEIIRDLVLSDDRFGLNLERVKTAAAIAAALDAALATGTTLDVDDAQYRIIREVIEQPSRPYNASVARFILPLLQHVIDAGQVSIDTVPQS